MLRNLDSFLDDKEDLIVDSSHNLTSREAQVAVLVILSDAARSDEFLAPEEFRMLAATVGVSFNLKPEEVGELMEIADFLSRHNSRREQFIDIINKQFNNSQKLMVLSMLWQVILADGRIDDREEVYFQDMKTKLNVTDELVAEAKRLGSEKASRVALAEKTYRGE